MEQNPVVSFYKFMELYHEGVGFPEYWRMGQRLFNVLHMFKPGLADYLRGTAIDPFYNDANIKECLRFIAQNWEDFD